MAIVVKYSYHGGQPPKYKEYFYEFFSRFVQENADLGRN